MTAEMHLHPADGPSVTVPVPARKVGQATVPIHFHVGADRTVPRSAHQRPGGVAVPVTSPTIRRASAGQHRGPVEAVADWVLGLPSLAAACWRWVRATEDRRAVAAVGAVLGAAVTLLALWAIGVLR